MYCRNCGEKIDDKAVVCPFCGVQQKPMSYSVNDNGTFLWGFLGFFIPVAGLILYIVWKDEKPNSAKAAGTGALISVLLGILLYILPILLFLAGFGRFPVN